MPRYGLGYSKSSKGGYIGWLIRHIILVTMVDLEKLNEEQKEAVTTTERLCPCDCGCGIGQDPCVDDAVCLFGGVHRCDTVFHPMCDIHQQIRF